MSQHVHVCISHLWHVSHWHRGHAGTHPMTHRRTGRVVLACALWDMPWLEAGRGMRARCRTIRRQNTDAPACEIILGNPNFRKGGTVPNILDVLARRGTMHAPDALRRQI
eukprot:7388638-Prymnesium_polylepis.1